MANDFYYTVFTSDINQRIPVANFTKLTEMSWAVQASLLQPNRKRNFQYSCVCIIRHLRCGVGVSDSNITSYMSVQCKMAKQQNQDTDEEALMNRLELLCHCAGYVISI